MKTHSRRLGQLQEHFFANLEKKINQLKTEGRKVYRLDMGSPDLPPATHIIAALHQSADHPDHHGYQPLRGSLALRQAWAIHYQQHYAVSLEVENQVLPLIGSKEGIFLITQAIVDPNDIVLVPDPGYLVYAQAAQFAQADTYFMHMSPQNGWLPDLNAIPEDVARRARLMWLNYPNNPTSAIATREFFNSAVEFAHQHDLLLCHDAAYNLVTFNGNEPLSLLQIPGATETAVEFNSLSKAYNMAGWRIGAMVGNSLVVESLYRMLNCTVSGSFRPANDAAVAALTGDQSWIVNRNEIYRRRRDLMLRMLRKLGWQADTPQAALYIWSRIPDGYHNSSEFCLTVLEKTGVSLTPGSVFGQQGEGYVRLSFTLSEDSLQEALDCLSHF